VWGLLQHYPAEGCSPVRSLHQGVIDAEKGDKSLCWSTQILIGHIPLSREKTVAQAY
jgi:hypothetical protein